MLRGSSLIARLDRSRRLVVRRASVSPGAPAAGVDENPLNPFNPPGPEDEDASNGVALAAVRALFRAFGIVVGDSVIAQDVPMSLSRFKRLVAQMPKIAQVVSQFESPEIQREVLQALVRAFESEDNDAERAAARREAKVNGHHRLADAPAFIDDEVGALVGGDGARTDGDESSIHS